MDEDHGHHHGIRDGDTGVDVNLLKARHLVDMCHALDGSMETYKEAIEFDAKLGRALDNLQSEMFKEDAAVKSHAKEEI